MARFRVLYPNALIEQRAAAIQISQTDHIEASNAEREFLHLLYRERIYAETLSMRRSLLQALTKE